MVDSGTSYGKESRYVRANAIEQVGPARKKPKPADVWLGGANQLDENGDPFVTVEVQPAYGQIAQVRLSPNELRQLGRMIGDRLGDEPNAPIEVIVPSGGTIKVTYLGNGPDPVV